MRLLALPSLIAVLLLFPSRSPADSLEQVLVAMEKASAEFRNMSAKLTRVDHTAVINETTEETGSVRLSQTASREIRMVIEFAEPDARTVAFEKNTVQIYYPKIQTVQFYDLGKQRALVNQFLLLGFGTSVQELRRNYALKAAGEEQISGEQTTRLGLVPKSAKVLEHLKAVELWISSAGYPVQQKFYRPAGDYTQITYQGVRVNATLAEDAFRLRLPREVKREYPQK